MSKPIPVQATRPGAVETDDSDVPVTPEVEHIIRERLETFDEDAKAARPWEDVLADLKARRPLPPSPPLTHPVRLSALAALDIQQAREWHDAREPGLGDQFLQRVNETMTRIGQNPHQYPTIIEDVRRANLRQFKYGIWYRVNADGSVVVACLHRRQQLEIAKARALGREPSS